MKVVLRTRDQTFHSMHKALDATRKDKITVSCAALTDLLIDHSNLVNRVGMSNVEFKQTTGD